MSLDRRQFIGLASGAAALSGATAVARQVPGTTSDDPLGVRVDFPTTDEGIYLNAAYITPSPTPVFDAGLAFLERKRHRPIPLDEMLKKTEEVRGQFARLVHASPEEIGFLFTTGEGENVVTNALDLAAGDNVVIDELHYNTTFVLYRELERTRGLELRIVKSRGGAVDARDFEPLVDQRTRLVSVALVSHQNGFRHDMRPLADLAHAHGALLYTDAVQAVGMFPVDVRALGVDFLAAGTYKWMLGGFAPAPFFIRRELLDRVGADRFGWLGVARELPGFRYELHASARKFEYGTLPFAEIYQLGAGLSYLDRVGVDRIERHTVALAAELHDGLTSRGLDVLTPAGNQSSIVAFRNPKALGVTRAAFDAAGVQVSFREQGTQIRVAPALFNNRADIHAFLASVDRVVAQ